MRYKTLDDFDFKNKTVLLRLDLNTEIAKGKPVLSQRMKAHARTLNELRRKKAKTVVLAHQSRPGKSDFTSLRKHAKLIKAKFVPDICGPKAKKAIQSLKPGEVLLLENLRFQKEEEKPTKNNPITKALAPLADIYINDAFSVSHRDHTSVTGFAKLLPSGIGRVLEEEISHLEKISLKGTLFILGGAKPKENLEVLKKNKNVITDGIFGQLCTIAQGRDLGAQNQFLKEEVKEFVPKLKRYVKNVQTPIDFAVKIKGKRKELPLSKFPSEHEIYDIGKKTQDLYVKKIKKAKSIFMKGVAGYCEDKQFCKGTEAIFKAITSSKAFSVVGGGHTTDAIAKLKINRSRFGYISLSGGALR
jgi:phosphoglycerate kinase